MIKANVIIGTDLSESSDLAIDVGINWAKKLNCEATVMHIHHSQHIKSVGILNPEFEDKASELAHVLNMSIEKKLEEKVSKWRNEFKDLHTLIVYGDKIKKFIEIASTNRCKLLVIPFKSDEDDSILFGSMVERLIRLSPVPVLIVKDDRVLNPRSISFPFAFQGLSQDAASWVEIVSSTFDAEVHPIHVLSKAINIPEQELKAMSFEEIDELYREISPYQSMKKNIELLNLNGKAKDLVVKTSNGGSSKAILLENVIKLNPDLVIMGSSGKMGLERLYLGSFSEYILKNVPSSILITKKF